MQILKFLSISFFLFFSGYLLVGAQTPYDAECAGFSSDGHYLLKVSCTAKTIEQARLLARRSAIHCVLTAGFSGNAAGCTTVRPMIADSLDLKKHESYLSGFIKGDDCLGFASICTLSASTPPVKVKNGYRVTLIIDIDKDGLRGKLEKDGIIHGLSYGF